MTNVQSFKKGAPDSVEYTISQDRGAGNSTEAEADYVLLTGKDFELASLPRAQVSSGNHALQDYQTQLMLLEQQNKKRLMMAREELDEENTAIRLFQEFNTSTMNVGLEDREYNKNTAKSHESEQARDEESGQDAHLGTSDSSLVGGEKRNYEEFGAEPRVESPTASDPPIRSEGEGAGDSEPKLKRSKPFQDGPSGIKPAQSRDSVRLDIYETRMALAN